MYRSNGEWSILGAPAIRHVFYYLCCIYPYPDVTFYLQVRKKKERKKNCSVDCFSLTFLIYLYTYIYVYIYIIYLSN